MASLSVDTINDTVITEEQFGEIASQTLADYPFLVPKAIEKFSPYVYHTVGDDGKPTTKDTHTFSNIGNAKAVLSSLVDNADYEKNKYNIQITQRIIAEEGNKMGWSTERIALEQDRSAANTLGISTAVLDKRLELTQLLNLAKEIGYVKIDGREDELTIKAMQNILRQSFGDTTAERLSESITGQGIINYTRDLSSGELDASITDHLGDFGQTDAKGGFKHRDVPTWLKRPGVSQGILNEIIAANWDIGSLQEGTAAYEAVFNYKEENYREKLTQINSKAAVFAGSELSRLLDEQLFKVEK